MEITTLNGSDFNSNAFRALNEEQQLKQTAQQFEAILFRQMLDKSLKPIFKSEKNLTVVTSAECFVIEKDASSFSLFSPLYFEHLKKMGIFACSFSENKFGILIDIRKFLDFYNKKTKTIKSVKKK